MKYHRDDCLQSIDSKNDEANKKKRKRRKKLPTKDNKTCFLCLSCYFKSHLLYKS